MITPFVAHQHIMPNQLTMNRLLVWLGVVFETREQVIGARVTKR